jgi:6,7-dimethyl-8-ribityllumazine synthase
VEAQEAEGAVVSEGRARMRIYPADLNATGMQLGVVVARFNHLISTRLLDGCSSTFLELGGKPDDLHVAWVPGAFEIPLAARLMAESGRYAAIVTLGSVIRGGTPHFEYVCDGVTQGLGDLMRDSRVPIAFGVLTLDDIDQALDRAGGAEGNKGADVTRAAIEMANLRARLDAAPAGDL